MSKSILISVSGLAHSAVAEGKCLDVVRPFIDSRDKPTTKVVFDTPDGPEINVKIDVENFVLLRHQKQLERPLKAELTDLQERMNRSSQFHYVPGITEASIEAVIRK